MGLTSVFVILIAFDPRRTLSSRSMEGRDMLGWLVGFAGWSVVGVGDNGIHVSGFGRLCRGNDFWINDCDWIEFGEKWGKRTKGDKLFVVGGEDTSEFELVMSLSRNQMGMLAKGEKVG